MKYIEIQLTVKVPKSTYIPSFIGSMEGYFRKLKVISWRNLSDK